MKILTASQMVEVDRLTSEVYHIPSILLMESAGRAVVEELARVFPDFAGRRILVICGKGNNGGDGFVAARYMALRGASPELLICCDPAGLKGDALINWGIVRSLGLAVRVLPTAPERNAAFRKLRTPDIIIDALFGTGLSKPIGTDYRQAIEWINRAGGKSFVISVDIPSGLFADRFELEGPAVKADVTVTFTAPKLAHIIPPAADHAGRLVIAPIGSPPHLLDSPEYRMELIDSSHVKRALPPRPKACHKGNFGHVFVVAGSRGKSGAALMTGLAALRCGAGLVTLWLPAGLQAETVGKIPELMTEPLPETPEGTSDFSGAAQVLKSCSEAHALVIGPGMTTHPSTRDLILGLVRRSPVPLVLDADAINSFAGKADLLHNELGRPIVVTPHPGEMARLLGSTITKVQKNRLATAREFAQGTGIFTVLKGFQSLVASPAGRLLINNTGNPGMATGGSGDILAGMVARFVAGWYRRYKGVDLRYLEDSVAAAVHIHGIAGDLAAQDQGMESLIATDLLQYLPGAFRKAFQ